MTQGPAEQTGYSREGASPNGEADPVRDIQPRLVRHSSMDAGSLIVEGLVPSSNGEHAPLNKAPSTAAGVAPRASTTPWQLPTHLVA